MTTAEMIKPVQASTYSSLLRVLHVLYRQGMHTPYQLRGTWELETTNKAQARLQTHTKSFSQPPFFYVPTYSTHHITQGSAEAKQDFSHNHRRFALFLFLFSLRWITNNNYYIFFFLWEPSKRESEVFRRFASSFFLTFLSFPFAFNITYHTYHSERLE